METNITTIVFEGEGFPVDESLLINLNPEFVELVKEMMYSGHYQNGLDVSKFLREDLSINLDKLSLACALSTIALESKNAEEDSTLNLIGLDKYFEIRGILGNERQMREERTFLIGFISAEAMEASRNDTLVVKYVQ